MSIYRDNGISFIKFFLIRHCINARVFHVCGLTDTLSGQGYSSRMQTQIPVKSFLFWKHALDDLSESTRRDTGCMILACLSSKILDKLSKSFAIRSVTFYNEPKLVLFSF